MNNELTVNNQFLQAQDVIAIHLMRYDKLIDKLLAVKDYSIEDVNSGGITWSMYYKAQEKRIKAYNECINTMIQKEKLLQFHNEGFQVEIIDERVEIRQTNDKRPDIKKLSFDEQLKLLRLIQKAKVSNPEIPPVIPHDFIEVEEEKRSIENDSVSNIEGVEIQQLTAPSNDPVILNNPTARLRMALDRLAAKKYKEAGATLTDEEEKLLN